MKKVKYILFVFLSFFLFINSVNATEKNRVNAYLFHSNTCVHCAKMRELLTELKKENDNLYVSSYEISSKENSALFEKVAIMYNANSDDKPLGVPFLVIGDKTFSGFSDDNTKEQVMLAIEYYSNYGYTDKVGEMLGNKTLPDYEVKEDDPTFEEYAKQKELGYKVSIPIFGSLQLKNFALPIITVILGLIDGFNPCAMWVLLFLLSMLLGMKNKKRMWVLGISFILTSAIIYFAFMMAWLNVATIVSDIVVIRIIISIVAIIGGIINIRNYLKTKEDGCNVVGTKKRNKIFDRIKKFTTEKSFFLALVGVILVAVSVNIVELACSAGIPVMFIEILSLNNLNSIQYVMYILLYVLFFMIDDLIVFVITMTTLRLTGISTKYGRLSHLIGGILLVLIGILLAFKPEWIMLNF